MRFLRLTLCNTLNPFSGDRLGSSIDRGKLSARASNHLILRGLCVPVQNSWMLFSVDGNLLDLARHI